MVMQCVSTQQWEKLDAAYTSFKRVRGELSVSDGLLLRGDRVVLPKNLHQRAVNIAHASHLGIVKTKCLLRETVWFPGIDKVVETTVANCLPCQANTPKVDHEPLHMTEMPKEPWSEDSVDFCGPFKSGEYLLVVIDDFSRFPEVEILHSTSEKSTIPKLDAIFARQGIPEIVKTDNGPPFNGDQFASWAKYIRFKHRKITPIWPEANGEAERFMRTLTKAVRSAVLDKGSWRQEICTFLRHYRAAPHSTTGISPAELLYQRPLRTEVPRVSSQTKRVTFQDQVMLAKRRDERLKGYMKELADKRNNAKVSELQVGDTVLVKQPKEDKLTPYYRPVPYQVTKKKGNMVTVAHDGHTITRNSSHMKKCPAVVEIG